MASSKENTLDFDNTQDIYASSLEHKTEVQGGEIHGDSSAKLAELESQDKEMVERWKDEADTVLVFAGLFSAVGTVSIVESYKWLSPDLGDATVELLSQLVNVTQKISLTAGSSEPFRRTIPVVMVNVLWFSSVAICIVSAILATLIQQWVRQYMALAQGRGTPVERARLRNFMINGLRKFQVARVCQLLSMYLHLSILLYALGIVVFISHIDPSLVVFSLCFLSPYPLIYSTFTFFPIFFLDCPYCTPFTALMWRLCHLCSSLYFSTILGIANLLHTLQPWPRSNVSQSGGWRETLQKRSNKHRQWYLDGLERSVQLYATEAPHWEAADAATLGRTVTDPIENSSENEAENFAAWVLDIFDTHARSGAEETVSSSLMSDQSSKNIFGLRLHRLLKICVLGTSALTEEQRRRRLRVCLECLWCWSRLCSQNPVALPSYFPLPNPDMIRRLQVEQDPTAAIIARCFSALVAKKLAVDVNSPDVLVRDMKLEFLSAILGRTRTELESLLSKPGAICLANIVSLTSSVMKTLFTEEAPPPEVLGMFRATVDILLAEDTLTSLGADLPPNLVSSFHKTYSDAQRPQAPDWLSFQLLPISEKLFVVSEALCPGRDIFSSQV